MKRRLLVGLLASLAVMALIAGFGCGDDDDGGEPTGTVTQTPSEVAESPTEGPTATEGPTPSPTEEPFSGGRGTVQRGDPDAPPVATQTDIRYAAHDEYDRVVFDFVDNRPGYVIEYVDGPILADGSGEEVDVAGEAYIQVRFSTAQAHDDDGNATVDELEIAPDLASIVEIEQIGDFEGNVTWVIGVPEELDFRVLDLEDPIRVVVDIGHP